MEEKGATIRSISARSGLSEDRIWEILQTRSAPDARAIEKIARALEVSVVAFSPPARPARILEIRRRGGMRRLVRPSRPGPAPHTEEELIERTALRQRALVLLLMMRGIPPRAGWDAKVTDLTERASGSPGGS